MKKQLSYKELQKFDNIATSYLIREGYYIPPSVPKEGEPMKPGYFSPKPSTKLVANIKNIVKQANKHFEDYREKDADLAVDNCAVDEKTKAILMDGDKYRFTQEGMKAYTKARRELSETKVEIHVRITEGEWDLSDEEREVFEGVVIPEQVEA